GRRARTRARAPGGRVAPSRRRPGGARRSGPARGRAARGCAPTRRGRRRPAPAAGRRPARVRAPTRAATGGRSAPGTRGRGRRWADIRRETEGLVRYYGELVRRLGQSGVRDVADLLALYERLGRALEAVSRQEIGWVTEQVQRLIEALVRMDADLDALRRL